MLRAALMLLVLGATGCGGGAAPETDDERCQRMAEHLADLRLAGLEPQVAERHRELLGHSVDRRLLEWCAAASRAYVDCVLEATDPAEVGACAARGGRS